MELKIIVITLIIFFSSTFLTYATDKAEKIKFSFADKEVIVILINNDAAKNLLKQLPLTVEFTDYAESEKIAYLPQKLNLGHAPKSCNAKTGDLTYYIPWGNLAFFYKDYGQGSQLTPIGKIETGLEALLGINNKISVKIEKISQ